MFIHAAEPATELALLPHWLPQKAGKKAKGAQRAAAHVAEMARYPADV